MLTIDLIQETPAHTVNVILHVLAGTVALGLGIAQLFTQKGSPAHKRLGRLFLGLFGIVMVTAAFGVVLFEFQAFLTVIALLSGYQALSGLRALHLRTEALSRPDLLLSAFGLTTAALFLLALDQVEFPWESSVIAAALAYLLLIAGYDLARFVFPPHWLRTTWIYEHLVKMIGAVSALASAFSATALSNSAMPLSQLAPPVLGIALMVLFAARTARRLDG